MRDAMIERLEKTLTSFSRLSSEVYKVVTQDEFSCNVVTDTLKQMIANLRAADDEEFLRAEGNIADRERRRLEGFGV